VTRLAHGYRTSHTNAHPRGLEEDLSLDALIILITPKFCYEIVTMYRHPLSISLKCPDFASDTHSRQIFTEIVIAYCLMAKR
jgi:hypothetical protein